jgi:hypothetical protein
MDQSVLAIHDSPLYYEISEDDHCGIIALTLCYMKYLHLYNILGTL